MYEIANKIAEHLESNLSFADRVVGLVKTIEKESEGSVQRFPAAINVSPTEIESGDYIDLVPNDTRKSIIYFDNANVEVNRHHNGYTENTGSLTLICWFNYEQLIPTLSNSSFVAAELIRCLPEKIASFECFTSIRLFVEGIPEKDGSIFSQYTYIEKEQQYWTYPYDYFTLKLSVYFRHVKDCLEFATL